MERIAKADDANRMIKWFLNARKHEKNIIITNNVEHREELEGVLKKIEELGRIC